VVSNYIKKLFRKTEKVIAVYRNCSELSIYNFDMAYKTNDYRYLVVGFDGYQDIKTPKDIEQTWKSIFDEWVKASDNSTIIFYYQLISEVAYLETRYIVAEALLLQIYQRDMDEETLDMYIGMLKNWKYIYNKNNNKLDELTRLFAQHNASMNKIGLKRSELKELNKGNEDGESNSLESQAVALEQILSRNNIDTKTTSVLKWIEICKVADTINNQRKKHHG
jgi:hypothetical protein